MPLASIRQIYLRPNMQDVDFDFKRDHCAKFLQHGDTVKLIVIFRGREVVFTDLAELLLKRMETALNDYGTRELGPIRSGKEIMMQLKPVKKKQEDEKPEAGVSENN